MVSSLYFNASSREKRSAFWDDPSLDDSSKNWNPFPITVSKYAFLKLLALAQLFWPIKSSCFPYHLPSSSLYVTLLPHILQLFSQVQQLFTHACGEQSFRLLSPTCGTKCDLRWHESLVCVIWSGFICVLCNCHYFTCQLNLWLLMRC